MRESSTVQRSSVTREPDISRLLNQADPAIRTAIRYKLRVTLDDRDCRQRNLDALDLLSTVRLKILQKLRDSGYEHNINALSAYAAKVAYNACSDLLRSWFPQRMRLTNLLRRSFEKSPRYRLVPDGDDFRCSLSAWPSDKPPASSARVAELRAFPRECLPANLCLKALDEVSPAELLDLIQAILLYVDGTVRFDDLVSIAAGCVQVQDLPDETLAASDYTLDRVSDASCEPGGFSLWLSTERMRLLWDAILKLLPWHRAALLLNLRDGDIGAFPYYGVASIEQIGDALALTNQQYAAFASELGLSEGMRAQLSILSGAGQKFTVFWNYLPVEDSSIAVVLGVQRSQVIAYRNKALERLRRMLAALA